MRTIFLIIILFSISSCKKFVTAPPPTDQLNTQLIFNNQQDAIAAVNGLYYRMSIIVFNPTLTLYPSLSADDIKNSRPNTNADPFTKNQLLPTTSPLQTLWTMYGIIYQANAAIEGLKTSKLDAATMNQLIGESKFVRALNYFYLLNLFGEVPLVTGTDYEANARIARTPADSIYTQMIEDLKDAANLLPESYPVSAKVRANKYAAMALLARVYLYHREWANAEQSASTVINSGIYSMEPDVNNVFLTTSNEAIFQLANNTPGNNAADALNFVPGSATSIPTYVLTPFLIAAFDPSDLRYLNWTGANIVGGVTYRYPYKYKIKNSDPATEYQTVIRLAELYLIRAEAEAQQTKITEGQDDLNTIRLRAGISPVYPSTQDTLLLAIEQERQRELMFEFGHRWLDLKRTDRIDAVLSAEKTGWTPTAALYPIPQAQINLNPALIQSPGY